MQILDPFHPMFERPVTRLLTTVLPILWSGLEFFVFNAPLWGAVFLVAGFMPAICSISSGQRGRTGASDQPPHLARIALKSAFAQFAAGELGDQVDHCGPNRLMLPR